MDAKTAVEILRKDQYFNRFKECGEIADYIEQQAKQIEELIDDNGQQHIEIMLLSRKKEQQEKEAELGRLFLKALKVQTTDKRLTTIVCKELPPEVTYNYCGKNCEWTTACKLRAELLAESDES